MALNKTYWRYSNADFSNLGYDGLVTCDKSIYQNTNFTFGALDFSFCTSFRKGKVTCIETTTSPRNQSATTHDAVIYNSMIREISANRYGAYFKDNILAQKQSSNENAAPVIDIDTSTFAFKMTVSLFSAGNWITVNAVDFVNNYAQYGDTVYGYINNYYTAHNGNSFVFENYYDAGQSIFGVMSNNLGYRTSGYGDRPKGGHVVSAETWYSDTTIWQMASTSGLKNYSTQDSHYNMYIPYEIPELAGQSWTGAAPNALMTAGYYTNHAVLVYSGQRVYMPLKHILKDIIVNCGLVLLDSNDDKWISMVDDNGLCQNKLVLLSSDEAKESSIYNTRTADNNLNPDPPPPGPPGDDEDNTDPVSTTGAPFGTGLAHYYVTTVDSAVLGQISEALGSWNIGNTKKDLYRNLISCKILKPPAGIPSTPSVFTIYGVKPQYNGADITIPAVNGNPDITFGPYSISRKFNDFRDYAPYTRAEIFLPYCGWCALPSHVVGRSVSVSYFTDVIAGTVKAVVFCGENPVAEAAGVMAYDIPFAAQNVGAKIQAANTGMLAYGKAALQLSAGIGQAVATKGKQGMSSIVNGAFGVAAGYNQLSMAANENYTEISGKAGDGCALAGIDTIIIKIVRPKYGAYTTPPYVPDGFAHTVGFLSMKEAKVSAASGLILCDNVDTTRIGKATDAERAEIKRVLETGLYVNNPPE